MAYHLKHAKFCPIRRVHRLGFFTFQHHNAADIVAADSGEYKIRINTVAFPPLQTILAFCHVAVPPNQCPLPVHPDSRLQRKRLFNCRALQDEAIVYARRLFRLGILTYPGRKFRFTDFSGGNLQHN